MGNNALLEFERANVGDFVKFGCYPQTVKGEVRPVEWQVLARENNRALVLSRYGLSTASMSAMMFTAYGPLYG